MKRSAFIATEAAIALGILVVVAGTLIYYRGPIAAKIRSLRGGDVAVVAPTPTPVITPLPATSFPPSAEPSSIASLAPAGGSIPDTGPADMPWIALGASAAVAAIPYLRARRRF